MIWSNYYSGRNLKCDKNYIPYRMSAHYTRPNAEKYRLSLDQTILEAALSPNYPMLARMLEHLPLSLDIFHNKHKR